MAKKTTEIDIRKIERIAKIVESIKTLDSQISQIEQFVLKLVDEEIPVEFQLKISTGKKDSFADAIKALEEDISSKHSFFFRPIVMHGEPVLKTKRNSKKKDPTEISFSISNNESLSFLGIILGNKQRERQNLMNQLKRTGVK